jgi:hypothetical protein
VHRYTIIHYFIYQIPADNIFPLHFKWNESQYLLFNCSITIIVLLFFYNLPDDGHHSNRNCIYIIKKQFLVLIKLCYTDIQLYFVITYKHNGKFHLKINILLSDWVFIFIYPCHAVSITSAAAQVTPMHKAYCDTQNQWYQLPVPHIILSWSILHYGHHMSDTQVCVRAHTHTHTHTHIYILHIINYMLMSTFSTHPHFSFIPNEVYTLAIIYQVEEAWQHWYNRCLP